MAASIALLAPLHRATSAATTIGAFGAGAESGDRLCFIQPPSRSVNVVCVCVQGRM